MSRANWKVLTNTENSLSVSNNQRKRKIVVSDIGKVIMVYNGIKLNEVRIQTNMLGLHLGDLVFTKRYGMGIHNKNVKLKKKKK
jgi:ribosomal protein S19